MTKKDSSFTASSHTKQRDEDRWECKHCSTKNSSSEKRCQSCAKPRSIRPSPTGNAWNTTHVEEPYDQSSSSVGYQPGDDYNPTKSKKKGKYSCQLF